METTKIEKIKVISNPQRKRIKIYHKIYTYFEIKAFCLETKKEKVISLSPASALYLFSKMRDGYSKFEIIYHGKRFKDIEIKVFIEKSWFKKFLDWIKNLFGNTSPVNGSTNI